MFTVTIITKHGTEMLKGISMFKDNAFDMGWNAAQEYLKGLGLTSDTRRCTLKIRYEAGNSFTEWTRDF